MREYAASDSVVLSEVSISSASLYSLGPDGLMIWSNALLLRGVLFE